MSARALAAAVLVVWLTGCAGGNGKPEATESSTGVTDGAPIPRAKRGVCEARMLRVVYEPEVGSVFVDMGIEGQVLAVAADVGRDLSPECELSSEQEQLEPNADDTRMIRSSATLRCDGFDRVEIDVRAMTEGGDITGSTLAVAVAEGGEHLVSVVVPRHGEGEGHLEYSLAFCRLVRGG